ncbi:MAG: hypothetical protein LQ345_001841 [Seirophora villosa]|nr:MAG: hypothetical protein LQ345_001841 [Seirophora villosa]
MRLHAPIPPSTPLVLFLLFLTPLTNAALSPTLQLTTNHGRPQPPSNPPASALSLPKRGPPFSRATIANGWQIHYRIISLILPAAPALLDLHRFYNGILDQVAHRIVLGDPAAAVVESSLGQYTLQFMAERGFDTVVHWEIIQAFVEKMLESTFPATFAAHIAPPGSDVGIVIKMWVGKHP